jgi:ATP-dependent RNA helicase SUPV3L1/SUV3
MQIQDKQFRLNDAGEVLFQPDPTNPLPGQPVATLKKGEGLLAPAIVLNDGDVPVALTDAATAQTRLNEWIVAHVNAVLGPLVGLGADAADVDTPVAHISRRLQTALGILPRAELEEFIEKLDSDGRRDLRTRRVRLGPVLVSMPDLNKPAAVRLRALLWTLWNDKSLPVQVPADGMVSKVIEPENIDAIYFRSIGYPVYARRAIRVDMLDRVISAIYDNADKGVFKAKHEMAEWLGCPIAELYEILTAMGHSKISDPADAPKPEVKAEEAPAEEKPAEEAVPAAVEAPAAETPAAESPAVEAPTEIAAPVVQVKPELATFRLRRGRAHEARRDNNRPPRAEGEGRQFRNGDKAKGEGYKGHKRKEEGENRPREDRKRDDRKKDFKKGDRPFRDNRKPGHEDRGGREDRVVATAEAKQADSPFAILNQLKAGRKE